MKIKYLTKKQVINTHDILIQKFGGAHGIRDNNLLISAINEPKSTFDGEELYQAPHEKAAVYMFHLIKNHPFIDGNKRTGTASALIFLRLNGLIVEYNDLELVDTATNVAAGTVSKTKLSAYLKKVSCSSNE